MAEKEADLAKCVPLGPFPRIIWIHQDTPLDRLDEVCYDIWKRTQRLPDGLKPKHTSTLLEEPKDVHAELRAKPVINKKDELTCLVEQEYMNLIMENLFDCCQSLDSTIQNKDIEVPQALMIEKRIKALLFKKESPKKILPKKSIKRWSQDRYVVKKKATNQGIINNDCSKTEDHNLIAHSPVKTIDELSTKTTEAVMSSSLKTSGVTVTLNSENPRTENQDKEKSQQLSVFAKLCSNEQDTKSQKSPPGFTMVPRVSIFPGMIRPRKPNLAPLQTPSPAILIPRIFSCLRRFPHPGPRHNFPGQYQARFLQRPPVPFLHGPQVVCYPRQFYSVTPQHIGGCFFYPTFVPQVNNLQHVRLNSLYQQMTAAMPIGGPQFYHHAYRFSSTITGTIQNSTYAPSFRNNMRPW